MEKKKKATTNKQKCFTCNPNDGELNTPIKQGTETFIKLMLRTKKCEEYNLDLDCVTDKFVKSEYVDTIDWYKNVYLKVYIHKKNIYTDLLNLQKIQTNLLLTLKTTLNFTYGKAHH